MSVETPERTGPTGPTSQPLLTLRGIQKSFGAVHVLRGVDLDVRPGRVTALVGDNGAGKSTLIKGIAGIHPFDEGEYEFDGAPVKVHGPKDSNALGIEVVYQDLALCDNLDVVHNMFLGREITKGGLIDEDTMERRARETLDGLSVRTLASVRTHVSACPVVSARPSRSPARCCGTPRSSSSTSRPPRWASPRPSRSSSWSDAWPTAVWASC